MQWNFSKIVKAQMFIGEEIIVGNVINDVLQILQAITITSGLIVVALIIPAAIVYSVI